ncbi:Exportin-T [Patellaria atrata CBS 101060]|uniref:Exportin-T n=1 Tax=Patellaria atrata CBS 101060 TaxID=1346257 RepID=A0A9P4VRR3_9PEZI|nr:Exportin-T [Patellaria atrata CBS 101060]
MDAQIEEAVQIAWNPGSNQNLKSQAFNFLNDLRADTSAWQVCLSLFTRTHRPAETVRHYSLEIVNNSVQAQQLDPQSLTFIKDNLMSYIIQNYGQTSNAVDTPHIQNKLTQTITYLFTSLYASSWRSFFDEFRALSGDENAIGIANPVGTILYLRILQSVHDEIADVLVARSPEEQRRNTELKDIVRVQDAQKIALSWQEILAKWRQVELPVIEMCLKTVSRWVSWIDISLVVNQAILSALFDIAGIQDVSPSEPKRAIVRDTAVDTFTEIVAKKMKPADKIELLIVLNLNAIVSQLVSSPALSDLRTTPNYDVDLAEAVAKLVNTAVFDIVKVLETDSIDPTLFQRADELLQAFVPHLLRFFADEYDEVCSTVIPSLTDLLTVFRKLVKVKGTLPSHFSTMLSPILNAIISKMKYDETANWGDEDEETDEAEFQELRKRLLILQQSIAIVDEQLYMDTLSNVVGTTFNRITTKDSSLDWRELDLALHEMYLFGELALKNGGMYAKRQPSSIASQRLVEMMSKMVESDIASFWHPAVQLQYMEICVRYSSFFEHNAHLIPKVLEQFVRITHVSNREYLKVQSRSWYLFLRFVKPLRMHLGGVSQTVIQAIGDLLTIKAELPEDSGDDDMSSDEADHSADAIFNSQLNLFEAIGCISSPPSVPIENKVLYAQSVLNPLFADLEQNLAQAKNGDERAILQIHHITMAIGTLARGFSDWTPGSSGAPPPTRLSEEFARAAEVILVALESLRSSMNIRTSARFAFSRLLGVLGSRVLQQLPRWIDGLLSQSSTKDEMATFLRLLDQVVHSFKTEIYGILDTLLTPLLQRVFAGLQEPTTGTDDEIQLAELRREYLNFLLIILNNELASVLVSGGNQQTFESIITTIEHFARDSADYPNARLAISVLIRMTVVWGGLDVPLPTAANPTPLQQPSPTLPGFDSFATTRFSPLCWSILTTPGFSPKDPQARQLLLEVAGLQREILKKTGSAYLDRLREELSGIGVQEQGMDEYLGALVNKDDKGFKQFFLQFIGRATGG